MNEQMPAWAARMDEKLDGLCCDMAEVKGNSAKINSTINGDGTADTPGLNARVIILEQDREGRKEYGREVRGVAWGALVIVLGDIVIRGWNWLARKQ